MQQKDAALITVCELGRLGDIVASEPLYRYLKQQYPDRKLRWYTRADYAELLKYCPAVDEVVSVRDASEYLELKKDLPAGTVSYELNFRDPALPRRKQKELSDCFPSLLEQFAVRAGLPVLDETPVFHFRPGLTLDGLPERYAVFHCCSNGRSRQWSRKNWLALAQMFLDAGWHIVEIGIYPFLNLDHPHYIDRTGKLDLQYAAKLIASSRLLLGVESGFGHIANATGIFSIILTGKLHHYPDYVTYSGRYRRGEGCNLVRFYDVPSEFLPLETVREVVQRFLDGHPMSYEECRAFCFAEQVKLLHAAPGYRLKRLLLLPFERLVRSIAFHRLKHGCRKS